MGFYKVMTNRFPFQLANDPNCTLSERGVRHALRAGIFFTEDVLRLQEGLRNAGFDENFCNAYALAVNPIQRDRDHLPIKAELELLCA